MTKITAEEYIKTLKQLEYIKKEEQKYQPIINNKINFKNMSQTFEYTIIALKEVNQYLISRIKLTTTKYLVKTQTNSKDYKYLKNKTYIILYNFYNSLLKNTNLELDYESKILLNHSLEYYMLITELKIITAQIYRNNQEIKYLNNLLKDRNKLITIKKNYKYQTKNNFKKLCKKIKKKK